MERAGSPGDLAAHVEHPTAAGGSAARETTDAERQVRVPRGADDALERFAGWWGRHRLLTVVTLALTAVALFVGYVAEATTALPNSDGANNVLQAWDMLHGNVLLHGWWLSDVSFYTTELPQYLLIELVRGLRVDVIHIGSAMSYTLILVFAGLLAKGSATGKEALLRVTIAVGIMVAPQLAAGEILLSSPQHVGTQVPMLLIWVLLDRLPNRWYLPVVVGVLLAWATIADELVIYVGALPLIVVSVIRLYRGRGSWRIEAGLALAAMLSVVVALGTLREIRTHGGFVVQPTNTMFASAGQMPNNVWLTVEGVLRLFGADFFGDPVNLSTMFILLHLVGLLLAAAGAWLAARRLLGGSDRIVGVLLLGLVVDLAAYLLGTQAVDPASAREIAAVLPFGAVLAGRLLATPLARTRLLPAFLAVLVCYLGTLGFNAMQPGQPANSEAVAGWLRQHGLTYGVAEYWDAGITTLLTDQRVKVRQVSPMCGRIQPQPWETKRVWYDPSKYDADFLLVRDGDTTGLRRTAIASFGRPATSVKVDGYTVMVWHKNLLAYLANGRVGACPAPWQRLRDPKTNSSTTTVVDGPHVSQPVGVRRA